MVIGAAFVAVLYRLARGDRPRPPWRVKDTPITLPSSTFRIMLAQRLIAAVVVLAAATVAGADGDVPACAVLTILGLLTLGYVIAFAQRKVNY